MINKQFKTLAECLKAGLKNRNENDRNDSAKPTKQARK